MKSPKLEEEEKKKRKRVNKISEKNFSRANLDKICSSLKVENSFVFTKLTKINKKTGSSAFNFNK